MIMKRILRDFECAKCAYQKDDFAEIDDVLECPKCGNYMNHVWLSSPNGNQLGKEGSDKSIAAMQKSFKQRFLKKEIDDVRHKHGKPFDESLASAAVKRIKEGEA